MADQIARGDGDDGTGKASPATASTVPAASASSGAEEGVDCTGGGSGTGAATPATPAAGHAEPCDICDEARGGRPRRTRHWCAGTRPATDAEKALAEAIDDAWDRSCAGLGDLADVRSPGEVAVDVLFGPDRTPASDRALAEASLLSLVDEDGGA